MVPLPLRPFPIEKIIGCNNETVFFISCLTVSVTPSINTPKSSNNFMISIKSFISSFETNKTNLFDKLIRNI